jgi:hypothetical protein
MGHQLLAKLHAEIEHRREILHAEAGETVLDDRDRGHARDGSDGGAAGFRQHRLLDEKRLAQNHPPAPLMRRMTATIERGRS